MKRESNFDYVKGTDIEKECYYNLKMAESLYESFPEGIKMSLRPVAETVLLKVVNQFNIYVVEKKYNFMMRGIKKDNRVNIDDVYDDFDSIRLNGNYRLHPEDSQNFRYQEDFKKEPIQLLEMIHKILFWYLKDITNQISKDKAIKFIEITNFNNENKELAEVRKKISQKDKNIDELKLKIKLLKDSEKDKSKELNKLIKEKDNINKEKLKLKEKDELLKEEIKEHDREIENVKRKYKIEFEEKIKQFKKEYSETEQASNENELTAVKKKIIIKNNEIEELNSKIDDLKEESKDKLELQKTIKRINIEKENLELRDSSLTKKIEEHNIKLKSIEEQYLNKLKSKEAIYLKEKEELNKIKQQIDLKNGEINKLRIKIDELEKKSNEINLLKISIDNLQSEKNYLEDRDRILNNKILEKNRELAKIKEDYKANAEKIIMLRRERNESNESLKKKEKKLINVEKENFELKKHIKKIEEQAKIEAVKKDEELKTKEKELQIETEKVRQAYKNSFDLTRDYQEVLEKSEYNFDKDEEKLLNIKKVEVKGKLIREDKNFHNNLNEYSKGMKEINEIMKIFKKKLDEKSIREGEYLAFYRGFLGLEGEKLRILYTIITKVNISSILINKSKELLSQSNEDKFMEYINRKAKELKNLSDEEIRLKIYYRLIKLTDLQYRKIYERKSFVETLDDIVNAGYSILESKKDFIGGDLKLEAIGTYYLEKVLEDFKNKYDSGNIKIQQEMIDKIYNNFKRLDEKTRKEIYEKLHLNNISANKIKEAVSSAPFLFLSTIISVGGFPAFSAVSSIIFDISHVLGTTFSYEGYIGAPSLLSFFSGPFMIMLFIVNGGFLLTQHKKQQLELVPLFIMQTIITNVALEETEINFDNYNTMIELWKKEKANFDRISLQKRMQEIILDNLTKERDEFAVKSEQISKAVYTLWEEHAQYMYKFKDLVISSDKKEYLKSYVQYSSNISKIEMAKKEIDDSKNKHGLLKSIFSVDMWKGQSSKLLSEMNITNIEKSLVEEAKQSQYFKEESAAFLEVQQKIDALNSIHNKTKEKIKDKNNSINVSRNKINLIENDLIKINSEYPDITFIN